MGTGKRSRSIPAANTVDTKILPASEEKASVKSLVKISKNIERQLDGNKLRQTYLKPSWPVHSMQKKLYRVAVVSYHRFVSAVVLFPFSFNFPLREWKILNWKITGTQPPLIHIRGKWLIIIRVHYCEDLSLMRWKRKRTMAFTDLR